LRSRLARIVGSALVGGVAGLAALISAELISLAAVGRILSASRDFAALYAAFGAVAALVVDRCHAVWTRSTKALDPLRLGAMAFALIGAAVVYHRVNGVIGFHGFSAPARVAAGVAALLAYLSWTAMLRIAVGPGRDWIAFVLAGLSVQVAIMLNQAFFFSSFGKRALLADAAIVATTMIAALLIRAPRRLAIAVGVVAAAALVAFRLHQKPDLAPVVTAEPGRPNLIFVLIDTLRADVFDRVISETEEGRQLHGALRNSAWFRDVESTAPWTLPSVASIMTGLYPAEHGLLIPPRPNEDSPIPPMHKLSASARTLAEELRDRGYVTAAIMTNDWLEPTTGIARGFLRYDFLACPSRYLPLLRALGDWGLLDCPPYEDAQAVRGRVIEHLADLEASRSPFFLWIHFMDPHEPLIPIAGLTPDPEGEKLAPLERLYRDDVRYAARELAHVLEYAASRPWWARTIVVVTADHGEMLPSDRRPIRVRGFDGKPRTYGHGFTLYEEITHVPLVIRPANGLPEERVLDSPTSLIDVRATLSDLMGLGLSPVGPPSYSLAPWLWPVSPETPPERRPWSYISSNLVGPAQEAIRSDYFKLIVYPNGEYHTEFYDLAADPGEHANHANRDPDELARTMTQLESTRAALKAPEQTALAPMSEQTREQLKALGYAK